MPEGMRKYNAEGQGLYGILMRLGVYKWVAGSYMLNADLAEHMGSLGWMSDACEYKLRKMMQDSYSVTQVAAYRLN